MLRSVPVRDDRGSVLLLGAGLLVVCVLVLTVLADASVALLQRQRLQAFADGAALAGAQAIDLPAYYVAGASSSTRLDTRRVGAVASDHLEDSLAGTAVAGLVVERIWSDGKQVVVTLRAPLDLPFLADLFPGDVRVESWAQLEYREYRDTA